MTTSIAPQVLPPALPAEETAKKGLAEAREMLALVLDDAGQLLAITSHEEYELIGAHMREIASKHAFLEQERKVTVTPLNDEVHRVNAWFKPATDTLMLARQKCEAVMGAWIMHQRREEKRLADEAAAAAVVALTTAKAAADAQAAAQAASAAVVPAGGAVAVPAPVIAVHADAAKAAGALVSQAAAAVPPKVAGVGHKPVFRWVIKDPASVPRALLSPDEKLINAHVKKWGNTNVPAGIEVTEDVAFTARSK